MASGYIARFIFFVILISLADSSHVKDLHKTLNYSPVLQGWKGVGGLLHNLQNLQHLDVCSNNIVGVIPIPFRLPPNATHMNMACCIYLCKNIRQSLSTTKKLRHLNLSHTFLFGPIGNVFTGLDNLEEIDVSSHNIVGVIPIPYSLLPNSTHMNMACCIYLSKNISHSLSTTKKLRHLNLSHNFLFGLVGNVFTGLDNLEKMNIQQNLFSGILPENVQTIPNLWIGGSKLYPLGDSPLWEFPFEYVIVEHSSSCPHTTQANANENFVRKHEKIPMGRGGIAFMVDGGTLLAKGFTLLLETGFAFFILIHFNKLLLRLRSFGSSHITLVSHPVYAAEDDQVRMYLNKRSSHTKLLMLKAMQQGRRKKRKTTKAESSGGRSAENTPAVPRKKAVLIGVMYYKFGEDRLLHTLDEVEGMKTILMENFNFIDQDITILCDTNKYTHPTKVAIQRQLTLLVEEANAQDILFVYIAGHSIEFEVDKFGIWTSDSKFITDHFLSTKFMPKVPLEATLTVMINTCFAGNFTKGAIQSVNVVVFPLSESHEVTFDGHIYYEVLSGILEGETSTNIKVYRQLKKAVCALVIMGYDGLPVYCPEDLPFYCPQDKKHAKFLRW
ncbi:protein STRUBBELIG-RECEPTOR FAMILY 2-like [Trifolium pratense]|uniref:protein STRUBBELIG-RECEPTOR FAMILY 2-like n=1 Tax=Trifolium pratense TaxID=57577 RepID=UPI001E694C71|nr:protein STRUBBELIG-RECEPTOR FAMILY 2-like [Trifolium pratense]